MNTHIYIYTRPYTNTHAQSIETHTCLCIFNMYSVSPRALVVRVQFEYNSSTGNPMTLLLRKTHLLRHRCGVTSHDYVMSGLISYC